MVEVEGAGDGEEDGEDDRGDFVGRIVPEAAVDCRFVRMMMVVEEGVRGWYSPYFPSSMMETVLFRDLSSVIKCDCKLWIV